jgi:hypothetical protein
MSTVIETAGSALLMERHFDAQDANFLSELRRVWTPRRLATFADRWFRDHRPWARERMFDYLDEPLDRPGHQPLVKRLFKKAEKQADDALMGAFMVAFDRLVRRQRKKAGLGEKLVAPGNQLKPSKQEPQSFFLGPARLFSYRTRYHLRRRAWRYFRRMGFRDLARHVQGIAQALRRYQDKDFERGENLLDNWGLMNALYRYSDVLAFGTSKIAVKPGRSLAELQPAPRFPEAWKTERALDLLLGLAGEAPARLVRVWAAEMIRCEHPERLPDLPIEKILALLKSDRDDAAQLGAELLEKSRRLDVLTAAEWLRLLKIQNPQALEIVCEVMARHVGADRLTLEESIALAVAEPAPVARAGFKFLQGRSFSAAAEREALAAVANAKSAAHAGEIAAWALGILGSKEHYDRENVIRFFDSARVETRAAAWAWLIVEGSAGESDPVLWARLLETPHEDLRLRLVDALDERAKLPGVGPDDLAPVWRTVLVGVHRGGRQRLAAIRQLQGAIAQEPARASDLLPVLALAVRSIRKPEARAGLAAVATLAETRPELAPLIAEHLPEVTFAPEEAAR